MVRRNRNVQAVIRVALGAVPVAIALMCGGVAVAVAGPVQPGVTAPKDPAEQDQPADFRSAAPQNTAPAPQSAPRPEKKPDKPEPPEAPAPRTVRIGEFSAPVPEAVPNELVDGVNRTTEGLQNALTPGAPQQPAK
ncbi:hypothetical protein [Nocardia blacklockiae]|uniref:hypothetical protein n=1 Tax=Nocardia blacklockiae TaxID=480036 RepID=UPI0018956B05|nr:hypothetical protein [Nocardia blacklockiae]MBF6175441.1 hypothetical protein [Nocardia blacklockiae]